MLIEQRKARKAHTHAVKDNTTGIRQKERCNASTADVTVLHGCYALEMRCPA